ncbi:MAG: hypothetical protein ACI9SI_001430 [Polaribacter sp.]|jgi:hypothetical protein
MDIENLIIGIIFIIAGISFITGFEKLIKKHGYGGLSFKLRNGGIGFIIIGIYLIGRELI